MTDVCDACVTPQNENKKALAQDPRLDPRIAEGLALMPENYSTPPSMGADYKTVLSAIGAMETEDRERHEFLESMLPALQGVEVSEELITGVDGNVINLYIHRPADHRGPIPGLIHLHGGGMAMMSATDPGYTFLRNAIAQKGLVVIGVEFRNSAGRLGSHPFPAGLNDCASAVQWAHNNKKRLGLSSLIVSGESGGGNLSLATSLKASKEGWIDQIDGVFACCPFISGEYAEPPAALGSISECDGYMLDQAMTSAMVTAYDPNDESQKNPLAWPMQALPNDLENLPAHAISVNELDPLRDEGLVYAHKLSEAGVKVSQFTVLGTPHAGELLFNQLVPDLFQSTIQSITNFAFSVNRCDE